MKNFVKRALRIWGEMALCIAIVYLILWFKNVDIDSPGVLTGVVAGMIGAMVPTTIGIAYDSAKKNRRAR